MLFHVTVNMTNGGDQEVWNDIVEMTREQADALRKEGEASVAADGDLLELIVEPVIVFEYAVWRTANEDLLAASDAQA